MTQSSGTIALVRATKRLDQTPPVWSRQCVWNDRPALIGLTDSGRIALVSDAARDLREYADPLSVAPRLDGRAVVLQFGSDQRISFETEDAAREVLELLQTAESQAAQRGAQQSAAGGSAADPIPPWSLWLVTGLVFAMGGGIVIAWAALHQNELGQRAPSLAGVVVGVLLFVAGLVPLLIGSVNLAADMRDRWRAEHLG